MELIGIKNVETEDYWYINPEEIQWVHPGARPNRLFIKLADQDVERAFYGNLSQLSKAGVTLEELSAMKFLEVKVAVNTRNRMDLGNYWMVINLEQIATVVDVKLDEGEEPHVCIKLVGAPEKPILAFGRVQDMPLDIEEAYWL